MKKWIVSKGYEGLADRLQSLSYCIDLAIKHNRDLYVDWNDSHWVEGFYKYFKIRGFTQTKPRGSCYPEFWNDALGKPAGNWCYQAKDLIDFNLDNAVGDEQVWVHPSIGFRKWNFNTLADRLEIVADVGNIEKVKKIVHLRGTDRPADMNRLKSLAKEHPDAVVVSDDAKLVFEWMSINPDVRVITQNLFTGTQGGHTLKAKNKHELNLEAIRDFMIIANAQEAYGLNEESLFFKMARVYGACQKSPKDGDCLA